MNKFNSILAPSMTHTLYVPKPIAGMAWPSLSLIFGASATILTRESSIKNHKRKSPTEQFYLPSLTDNLNLIFWHFRQVRDNPLMLLMLFVPYWIFERDKTTLLTSNSHTNIRDTPTHTHTSISRVCLRIHCRAPQKWFLWHLVCRVKQGGLFWEDFFLTREIFLRFLVLRRREEQLCIIRLASFRIWRVKISNKNSVHKLFFTKLFDNQPSYYSIQFIPLYSNLLEVLQNRSDNNKPWKQFFQNIQNDVNKRMFFFEEKIGFVNWRIR